MPGRSKGEIIFLFLFTTAGVLFAHVHIADSRKEAEQRMEELAIRELYIGPWHEEYRPEIEKTFDHAGVRGCHYGPGSTLRHRKHRGDGFKSYLVECSRDGKRLAAYIV